MNDKIVNVSEPVTLIGGGECSKADISIALELAPHCVAVDSGADTALSLGINPIAVIGDMDSISNETRAQISQSAFHHIVEQDSTDFDKALRNIDAPAFVAVGFAGGRIDHELATYHTLTGRAHQSIVVLTTHDVVFVCPPLFSLDMPADTRVSLFPMNPVTGRSKGLHWPIDGLAFAPGVRSGTSNRSTGNITLEMDQAGMLCILPRCFIQQVVQVLACLPGHARWPVREAPHKGPLQS